ARRQAAKAYNMALAGQKDLELPTTVNGCEGICESCDCHVFHQYTLKVLNGKREGLVAHLAALQIPCGVYYPIPLHRQKAYNRPDYKESDFKVTNELSEQVISLPMHTELDAEQINFITQSILDYLNA
ncbi:MAG: DegT/DnrJ/EryC1/StrS family aminotransferase, partial [Flavobacteriaceae bacterium]